MAAVRETLDLKSKTHQITITIIGLLTLIAVIAYSYFRSVELSNEFDEIAQDVSKTCGPSLDNEECPASGPIISAPYFIDGEIQGYRVYPSEDPELFDSTGLEPGDLVTAVDSQPLTTVDQANEFLESLIDGNPTQVTVEREGTALDIELLGD